MNLSDLLDSPVPPRAADSPVPLTPVQLRIWDGMIKQRTQLSSMRLPAISVRIRGTLNPCILHRSIEAVVQRHESLRTRIVTVDGTPRQQIHSACQFPLKTINLSTLPSKYAETEARQIVQDFMDEKVDVSLGPLFGGKLLKLSDLEHVLVVGVDHLVSDAISCDILSEEIWTLYDQHAGRCSSPLPPLTVQFGDYAVWQYQTSAAWHKRHAAYWKERLANSPQTILPRDEGLADLDHSVLIQHFPFGRELTERLQSLARHEQTSLPLLVLALYSAVISRWINQDDLVLQFLSHGRSSRPELKRIVGFIANFIFLRISIRDNDSFLDLLKRVDVELKAAHKHCDFGRVPQLIPECITEVGFNWLTKGWLDVPSNRRGRSSDGGLQVQPFPLRTRWPVIFHVFFTDTAAGVTATVAYRPDLFAKRTIERFGHNLRSLATECVRSPLASVVRSASSMTL